MTVYFSVLIFIILLCLFNSQKGDGKRVLFVCCLSIFLMSFLQNGWGGDGWTYIDNFDKFNGMSLQQLFGDESHGEIGFKLMYALMPSVGFCKLIGYGLFAFALYFFVYEFVPRKWWPLFFIMLFIDRSMLMGEIATFPRNGIAVAALLIAFHFLREGKRIVFCSILFAASFFHTSALFFIPFVFLPQDGFKLKQSTGLIISVVCIIISFVIPKSLINIVDLVIEQSERFNEYSLYQESITGERLFSILIVCPLFWIYELLAKSNSSECLDKERFIMSLAIIQILFGFLPEFGLKARFSFYLDYGFVAGLLVLLEKEKLPLNRWMIVVTLLFVYGKRFYEFVTLSPMLEFWKNYNNILVQ